MGTSYCSCWASSAPVSRRWAQQRCRRMRRCASHISTHYLCRRDVGPVARTEMVNIFGTPSRRRGTAGGLLGRIHRRRRRGGRWRWQCGFAPRAEEERVGVGRDCADLRCALQAYGEGPGRSRSGPISIYTLLRASASLALASPRVAVGGERVKMPACSCGVHDLVRCAPTHVTCGLWCSGGREGLLN